jgi:hypothetical protein
MAILHELNGFVIKLASDVPNPDAKRPPGAEGLITILSWAKWVGLGMCVLGLIIVGALMAVQSRTGEGGQLTGKVGNVLGGVVIIGAAGALVGFLAT